MRKSAREGKGRDGMLVLGFDAGCGTCSEMARRVEERVGDGLSVRNLNDPELVAWREETLGKDAKWAPTLFEVEGEKVRAWDGWKMGFVLSRRIGLSATWQVMQALGEIGAAPNIEESPVVEKLPKKAAEAVVGMSRGQFLKGVAGATLAMSVLSGTSSIISPVAAATRNPEASVKRRIITGDELTRVSREAALTRDVRRMAGNKLNTAAKIARSQPQAVMHTLKNGNTLLTVGFSLFNANRGIIYYKYRRRPRRGPRQQARAFIIRGKRAIFVNATDGGVQWRVPASQNRELQASSSYPLSECPPVGDSQTGPGGYPAACNVCGGRQGTYTSRQCVDYGWSCAARCSLAPYTCSGMKFAPHPVAKALAGLACAGASYICYDAEQGGCCSEYQTVQRPCQVYNC